MIREREEEFYKIWSRIKIPLKDDGDLGDRAPKRSQISWGKIPTLGKRIKALRGRYPLSGFTL